ncbi:MAG: ABC transporter ATP-binding protein [Bacteroidales bacterium]|nr:ABC transporter ATP-binding protein [Bacteroidales bacterium]
MLLQLENIHKGFGNPADQTYRKVLDDLSLQVSEGERIAILGPSGSGKTTLLNLIGALDHPDAGSVVFRGENITSLSRKEMDNFRNQRIGFVFQFHHLLPQCTVMENVLIPTLMIRDRAARNEKLEWAEHLLNRVGIWDHRDKLPGKLSGGECQRAAVVRAMINRPSLLLADEPTGALDRDNVKKMSDLLIDLNKNDGLTLLVVTHSQDLAGQMGQTYEIREGKITRN